MTIVEFLRARFDEDEAEALDAKRRTTTSRRMIQGKMVDVPMGTPPSWQRSVWPYDRVLREVEAKRRIVDRAELVLNAAEGDLDPTSLSSGGRLAIPAARREQRLVLRMLALPYADHPDYDPSWRP